MKNEQNPLFNATVLGRVLADHPELNPYDVVFQETPADYGFELDFGGEQADIPPIELWGMKVGMFKQVNGNVR